MQNNFNNHRPQGNPQNRSGNSNPQKMGSNLPQVGSKQQLSSKPQDNAPKSTADKVGHALYEMFWKTPYEKMETIIEMLLLSAGGLRTIDFLKNMGQSSFMAAFGLIYAELLILAWEYMGYKGKKVKVDTKFFWEREPVKRFPLFNQKNVAQWGLIVHLIMTAIFTTSDVILTNLKAISGASFNVETSFGWILGFGIGLAFALDLIFLLIYKNTNPEFKHQQEMEQLSYEIIAANFELERIEKLEEIKYRKKNATPLAETRAQLGMQRELMNEFGETLGQDFVKSKIEHVNLNVNDDGVQSRQQTLVRPRQQQPISSENRKPEGEPTYHPIGMSSQNTNKENKKEDNEKSGENFQIPRPQ